jgi:hypothetical protein
MRTKRWLFLLGIVLAGGGLTGVLLHVQGPPPTPLRVNYDQVRRGMTIEEVHAIMGKPFWPLLPSQDGPEMFVSEEAAEEGPWSARIMLYHGPSEEAFIYFSHGQVRKKEWSNGTKPTVWSRLRDRFGW